MNIEELKQKWGGSLPQVGDWVLQKGDPILIEDTGLLAVIPSICSPIPLTREVLGKVEEVREEEGQVYPYAVIDHLRAIQFGSGGDLYLGWNGGISIVTLKEGPTHLHQLQQLYRLLTGGKELTYTP